MDLARRTLLTPPTISVRERASQLEEYYTPAQHSRDHPPPVARNLAAIRPPTVGASDAGAPRMPEGVHGSNSTELQYVQLSFSGQPASVHQPGNLASKKKTPCPPRQVAGLGRSALSALPRARVPNVPVRGALAPLGKLGPVVGGAKIHHLSLRGGAPTRLPFQSQENRLPRCLQEAAVQDADDTVVLQGQEVIILVKRKKGGGGLLCFFTNSHVIFVSPY